MKLFATYTSHKYTFYKIYNYVIKTLNLVPLQTGESSNVMQERNSYVNITCHILHNLQLGQYRISLNWIHGFIIGCARFASQRSPLGFQTEFTWTK